MDELSQQRLAWRRRRLRVVAIVGATLLVGASAATWFATREGDDGPWCIWAVPTGRTLPALMGAPPVAEYDDVRDAPDGEPVRGAWETIVMISNRSSAPGLHRGAPLLLDLIAPSDREPHWKPTLVERRRTDGSVARAFVRETAPQGLPAAVGPDDRFVGTWEHCDGAGVRRKAEFRADGTIDGKPTYWGVAGGVLIVGELLRAADTTRVAFDVFVPSEDGSTLEGVVKLHLGANCRSRWTRVQ